MFFKWSKDRTIDAGSEANKISKPQPLIDRNSNDVLMEETNEDIFIDLDNMNWFKWIYHIVTMPSCDLVLFYNEKLELIDWDDKAKTLAQPLGHLLTSITFLMRFLQDNLIKPNYMNIYDDYRFETMFDFTKSDTLRKYNLLPQDADTNTNSNTKINNADNKFYIKMKNYKTNLNWYNTTLKFLDYLFYSLLLCVLISNVIVTYRFLFGYYKYYSLFYPLKVLYDTPDVSRKSLVTLTEEDDEALSRSSLFTMIKHFFVKNKPEDTSNDTYAKKLGDKEYYFELKKWIPSKFMTNLFMTFSPMCLTFLFLANISFYTIFAVLIHQYMFQMILNKYHNRIIDENVLFNATSEEYYMKVVKPLCSKKYQDAMVDSTPRGRGFVQFYPSSSSKNNKIFTTHSLKGDTLREKYNKNIEEFEEIEDEKVGHNVIVREPNQLQQVYWDPDLRQYIAVNPTHPSNQAVGTIPLINQVNFQANSKNAYKLHHGILQDGELNFKVMPHEAFSSGLSTPSVVSMPLNKATLLHNSAAIDSNRDDHQNSIKENISQYGSALNNTHNIESHPQSEISLKRGSISPLRQNVIYNNERSRTDLSPSSSKDDSR